MTASDRIAAALRGGTIPAEFLLGYGVVSSVPDAHVSAVKLNREWLKHDLDPSFIPQKRGSINTFRTACRSVETRRRATGEQENVVTEVKVDEINNTADECAYQITRLVRDKAERLIEHPKAMRIVYTKATDEITVEPLEPEHYRLLRGLEDRIRETFEANTGKVPGQVVRQALRSYMKLLGATNWRGRAGAFYFVPVDGKATLDNLRGVLEALYPHEEASILMLPVVNGEYERTMLERHYTVNASEEIDQLLADLSNYAKKGTIRKDRLDVLTKQRRDLEATKVKYEALLSTELEVVASKMLLLDEALELMWEKKYLAGGTE